MTTTTGPGYYELLDVPPDATLTQIKRAYRKLARKYHPDMNNGDTQATEHFKLITEAYDVLSDPAQRDTYDRTRPPQASTQVTVPGGDSDAGQRRAARPGNHLGGHPRPPPAIYPRSSWSSPAAPRASKPATGTTPRSAGTSAARTVPRS